MNQTKARTMTMTVDGIRLTFSADSDGTGELTAEAQSDGFQGRGSAWFTPEELHGFARQLRGFPLLSNPRPRLAGGFHSKYSRSGSVHLDQTHLEIEAYPVGARGQIGVRVRLASAIYQHDRPESQNQAIIEILSTYARLERFTHRLDSIASGEVSEAVLEAERLT